VTHGLAVDDAEVRHERSAAHRRFIFERQSKARVSYLSVVDGQPMASRDVAGVRAPRERPLGREVQESHERGGRGGDSEGWGFSVDDL